MCHHYYVCFKFIFLIITSLCHIFYKKKKKIYNYQNDLVFNWKFRNDDGQFEYKYPVCIFCHENWEFNWKYKNDNDQYEYKFPVCIFCHENWHENTTPQQHLMESCKVVFDKINLKMRQLDTIDQKYGRFDSYA